MNGAAADRAADLLAAAAASPLALAALLFLMTFLLEDAATIAAGLVAAGGLAPAPLLLAALVSGVVLGDLALYGTGRWMATQGWAAKRLRRAETHPARAFVARNALAAAAAARFVPGLRLPVFTLAGALRVSASAFAFVVLCSALIWTPALFALTRAAGHAGAERLGAWGWAVALAVVAAAAAGPALVRSLSPRRA